MQSLPRTSQINNLADWLDRNKQQVDELVISDRLDRLVHLFASNGNIELLQMLRQRFRANLSLVNAFGETPLLLACRYGHKHVTKYLLEQGANVKIPGIEKLLIWLPSFENDDIPTIAHDLIEAGAQVNLDDEECGSPLLAAVECCNITAVETLLNAGACVFLPDDEVGSSSCLRAVQQHQPEILNLLLSYDHSKLRRQNLHKTLLLAAIQSAGIRDLVHFRFNHCGRPYDRCADALLQVLRKYGVDLDDLEWSGISQHAVADGDVPMVSYLLKKHRQSRLEDQKYTNEALFYSIEANHFRFVQLLLDHGADSLAGPQTVGCHIMQHIALHGRGKQGVLICEELLRRGLAVDGTSAADAGTPLSIAVQHGSLEVAEVLLKYGANVNAIDSDGLTVLGALLASRDILGNEDTSEDKLARLRYVIPSSKRTGFLHLG
jgi:ankyrin repeat protein